MVAEGSFEVRLTPQQDTDFPAGRMLIDKDYAGGMSGTGKGQMLSKRTEGGAAAYCAVEEFSGTVDGRSGSFTLIHRGQMGAHGQSLEVEILEGSGTSDLAGIVGTMTIVQDDGGHRYKLEFAL